MSAGGLDTREKQTEGSPLTLSVAGAEKEEKVPPCARTVSRKSALAPVVWPGPPEDLSFAITFPANLRKI